MMENRKCVPFRVACQVNEEFVNGNCACKTGFVTVNGKCEACAANEKIVDGSCVCIDNYVKANGVCMACRTG